MKKIILALLLLFSKQIVAQEVQTKEQKDAAYTKIITERATKIVKTLGLSDSLKAQKVSQVVANQYRNLNTIHEAKKAKITQIKSDKAQTKVVMDSLILLEETKTEKALTKLHKSYVKQLSKKLSVEQVEGVKNGMTYSVFPNTYKAYQEMMPNLTEEQKKQLFTYLSEAREHAMDAESSEKKHAWFGKYKGRINNYLSSQGIDMKKMSSEWEAKIRAKETHK